MDIQKLITSLPVSAEWDEFWRDYASYRLRREPMLLDQWLRSPEDWLHSFERQLESALSPRVDWSNSGLFSNGFCSWAAKMRLV